MRPTLVVAAFVLLVGASPAVAAEPIVRAELSTDVVSVGQLVRLRITVLVPTWFSKPPHYPTFEIANAITRLPSDSSYPTSESVGDETWSGIVREYEIYPLVAARYQIPAQPLRLEFADPAERIPTAFAGEVQALEFRAVVPAGAERLDPFLAGRSLELERHVDGAVDGLQVGDAVVVRTVARLDGMTAIFLPPLSPVGEISGVGIYPDQPVVDDGEVASREEIVTYVFEKGGRYAVPTVALSWWNTDSKTIEISSLPEIHWAVEGPSLVLSDAIASERTSGFLALALAVTALLILVARYRVGYGLREGLRRQRETWRASEGYAFRAVRTAARSGDTVRFYENVLAWLERFEPGMSTDELVRRGGDERLRSHLHDLTRTLYSTSNAAIDLLEIERLLVGARRAIASERKEAKPSVLPPLNPG